MAAGINILVNDGGAPARIMKVGNAGADIDAGCFVKFDGTNVVVTSDDLPDCSNAIGVLFVDATSGDPASVMTGSGLICFLKAKNNPLKQIQKKPHACLRWKTDELSSKEKKRNR